MKKWSIVISIVLFFGLGLVVFFGGDSLVEGNTKTGQTRMVYRVIGLSIKGGPQDSLLSEWVGKGGEGENWLQVVGPDVPGMMISYCYPRLISNLRMMENRLDGEQPLTAEEKEEIARYLLEELERGVKVCFLSRQVQKAMEPMAEKLFDESLSPDEFLKQIRAAGFAMKAAETN